MKDSYKVLSAVVLSVLSVFGVQYGVINHFTHPEKASAQSTGGIRFVPGMHVTNYYDDTLPVSTTLAADVPYALPFENFFSHIDGKRVPTLVDVNGDGLTDMIYSWIYVAGGHDAVKSGLQWVALNVGDGYELVYFCQIDTERNGQDYINGAFEYRGTCAG